MKVIFLDFDGVLNNESSEYVHRAKFGAGVFSACPDFVCVSLIDILIERSNAGVIVSSSWRHSLDTDQLQDILREDFKLKNWSSVIGKTDSFIDKGETRGNQIDRWLTKHPNVTHHVIIDDIQEAALNDQDHNLVLCDARSGFRYDDLLKCYDYLGVHIK